MKKFPEGYDAAATPLQDENLEILVNHRLRKVKRHRRQKTELKNSMIGKR